MTRSTDGFDVRRVLAAMAFASLLPFASGCAMQQQQVTENLDRPIDCRTARGDLRVLESEKANVVQRMAEGATAIYPAGAVTSIIMGTESTKLDVAIGGYNVAIDQRIAAIKATCDIR